MENSALARLSPFTAPEGAADAIEIGARAGHNFAVERSEPGTNVFEAVKTHVEALQAADKRVVIALWSDGSRERMAHVLAEHGLFNLAPVASWPQALALSRAETALAVLGLDAGFATADVALITEEDILGERLVRPRRQVKRAENFIAEVTSLSAGDVVVHVDHGIGRFIGLRAIEAAGAPHDCLEIHYAGGDKLFLPVENIELLSRYGSEEAGVELDRLGSTAWQSRKARMKNRIREMAGELIKIAAERQLREAPRLAVESGLYDEFCAGFPYEETDDQQAAIAAVLADLASGRPMDRLICGDVGFGKTEVALRAAFITAMNGKQVAVVVPTGAEADGLDQVAFPNTALSYPDQVLPTADELAPGQRLDPHPIDDLGIELPVEVGQSLDLGEPSRADAVGEGPLAAPVGLFVDQGPQEFQVRHPLALGTP